jgi:hypothetical protein
MMKIRYALLLMMLGVACPAANGTYITLSQESGPGNVSINLGANGSLTGTIGISGINGFNNANAILAFSMTGPVSDGNGGYTYTGGFFNVYGIDYSLSENYEFLLSGQLPAGAQLTDHGYYGDDFELNSVFGGGSIASDLGAAYGYPAGAIVAGAYEVSVEFIYGNNYPMVLGAYENIVAQSYSVPEPGSATMAILGLAVFGVLRSQGRGRFRFLASA